MKWRWRRRGRRAGHVKRDFGVILVNDMKSFSKWSQKVLWTEGRTKIWTVTGRVITQQDRPHAHKSQQTHYCLLLLLSFCPSASSLCSTQVHPTYQSSISRGSILLLPDLSLFINFSRFSSWGREVMTHGWRGRRSEKRRCGSRTNGHISQILCFMFW